MKSETNTKEALEVLGEVGGSGWLGNFQKKIPIRQKRAKKLCMGSHREKYRASAFYYHSKVLLLMLLHKLFAQENKTQRREKVTFPGKVPHSTPSKNNDPSLEVSHHSP